MEPFEIEARLAIMDLVARYNRAGDTGRSEDFKEIFTGSGVFEMNGGRTAQGGQAIETLMEDVKRQFATAPAIFFPARHHVSGLTIDFADSDHATGREGCESSDHARTVAFDYMASVVSSFEEEGYEFLGDWKIQDELTVAHDLPYESNTLFPESEVLIIEIVSEISSHTHPVELWLEHTRTGTTVVGVIGGLHQGAVHPQRPTASRSTRPLWRSPHRRRRELRPRYSHPRQTTVAHSEGHWKSPPKAAVHRLPPVNHT